MGVCVWGGGGLQNGRGRAESEVLPLGKGRGGEISLSHVEAGITIFAVVLIWELELLTIPKGSQEVSTLQKGGGVLKRFTLS